MKKFFYIATVLIIFVSCKSKPDDADQNTAGKSLDQSPEMLQQFKPVINGLWVKKNYLKKVLKTKSPSAAADRAEGITTLYIDTAKIKGDKLTVPISRNNREVNNVDLKFQPGKNTTTIMLGDDELSYSIKRNDTTLIIYHYDNKKNETTTDKYIKAFNKPVADVRYGMDYMINKGMISGSYQATDATGKKFNVVFTNEGKVSGYPGFNTYQVQNDLRKAGEDTDLIMFGVNGENQKAFSFTLNKKVLTLYNTTANADSTQFKAGNLNMTLINTRK